MTETLVTVSCLVLLAAWILSQPRRSQSTPQVRQRVSREDLNRCAAIARRYFEEKA